MCGVDPVTAVAGGLTIAEGIGNFFEDRETARRQRHEFEKTRRLAEQDAGFELAQVRLRQRQEQEAIVKELLAVTEQSRQSASSAEVSAAEAGAAGVSVADVLRDFAALEAQYRTRADRQGRAIDQAFGAQTEAYRRDVRDQLISAWPDPQDPSFLSLGLDIASSVTSVFELTKD